jgi:hypothetical protein
MNKVYFIFSYILISHIAYAQKIKLFNGKDLDNWHVDIPSNDDKTEKAISFIIREKKLVSLGNPKGHLITNETYENYKLEIEYRFPAAPGNCGVLVHCSKPRKLYKMFPQSIEVQMMHKNAGDFWVIGEDIEVANMEKYRKDKENWGGTEDKSRNIKATQMLEKPLGRWNKMKIECREKTIKVWVNGKLVNDGYNATVSKGQIALQAEGAEVEFRKVELKRI